MKRVPPLLSVAAALVLAGLVAAGCANDSYSAIGATKGYQQQRPSKMPDWKPGEPYRQPDGSAPEADRSEEPKSTGI